MTPSLPAEVWHVILGYLSNNAGSGYDKYSRRTIRDLYNICLVSKELRSLAEQHLYQSYHLTRHAPWAYSVATNPHLAAHVRELSFDLSSADNEYPTALLNLAVDHGWELPHESIRQRLDLWILLLILCRVLPNLDLLRINVLEPVEMQLDLSSNFSTMKIRDLRIDYAGACGGPPAPSGYKQEAMGLEFAGFSHVLSCQQLKRLTLDGFYACDAWDHALTPDSRIRHLRLTNTCFDRGHFSKLLTYLPVLEQLEYHETNCLQLGCTGPQIMQVLTPIADRLKSLSLDLYHRRTMPWAERNFVPSFAKLSRVEDLTVDSFLIQAERVGTKIHNDHPEPDGESLDLFGEYTVGYLLSEADDLFRDYFPPKLKLLRIDHTYRNVEKSLTELSMHARSWMPSLEEVQISLEISKPVDAEWMYLDTVINEMTVLEKLNARYCHEEMTEVPRLALQRIPRRYLDSTWGRGYAAVDQSIDRYIKENVTVEDLPDQWQNIVHHFNVAGVRVVISNAPTISRPSWSSEPLTEYWSFRSTERVSALKDDKQMSRFVWL